MTFTNVRGGGNSCRTSGAAVKGGMGTKFGARPPKQGDKVEYSPNGMARCNQCKKKIPKGCKRIGIEDFHTKYRRYFYRYYHEECLPFEIQEKMNLGGSSGNDTTSVATKNKNVSIEEAFEQTQSQKLQDQTLLKARRDLRNKLFDLRRCFSERGHFPPCCVASDQTVNEIVLKLPTTEDELMNIYGFGKKKFQCFGDPLLMVVRHYAKFYRKSNGGERQNCHSNSTEGNQIQPARKVNSKKKMATKILVGRMNASAIQIPGSNFSSMSSSIPIPSSKPAAASQNSLESIVEQSKIASSSILSSSEQKKVLASRRPLYMQLQKTRFNLSKTLRTQVFMIFSNSTLDEIVLKMPTNPAEFLSVPGITQKKMDLFGDTILNDIKDYIAENESERNGNDGEKDPTAVASAVSICQYPAPGPASMDVIEILDSDDDEKEESNDRKAFSFSVQGVNCINVDDDNDGDEDKNNQQKESLTDKAEGEIFTGGSISCEEIVRQKFAHAEANGYMISID